MRKYLGGSWGMLPGKILKVETKICAVWGILEANLKKSSTLKFIMNISFLTSICIHRSIIWIFIGKKVCLSIFSNRNFFPHDFRFSFPRDSSVSATKLANIKIIWSKLETKEQTKFWFIGPYLVTPGMMIEDTQQMKMKWPDTLIFWMQSLTHISDSRILPNTNQFLLSLSAVSRTSICFSRMRQFRH